MTGDGIDTRSLGEANKQRILNALRERGNATLDELVQDAGRSAPTVLKWLGELEREGYLRRDGHGRSTGGRRPVLYRFNAERGYLLGLAIEIPDARLTLVDLRGHEVDTVGWQLDPDTDAAELLAGLLEQTTAFMRPHAANGHELLGACVAMTGFIDRETGSSLATPRVRGWKDVPVRQAVEDALNVPVVLHHHIDGLTLAESCFGSAAGRHDFLYFDVGHGLGVRAVRGGELIRGRFGNAGLIGHATVALEGRPCLCGNRGCLEEYVSGRVVLRDHAVPGEAGEGSTSDQIDAVAERLFRSADGGDDTAAQALTEIRRYLAIGVATAVNMFDLPHVVLSGFVRAGGDRFRARLQDEVRSRLQPTLARHTRIELADVPRSRAAGHGAALFALAERFPFAEPLVANAHAVGREVSAEPKHAVGSRS